MGFVLASLIGGALCLWLDYLHATHGVTGYFRADLGLQPWWTPFLFVGATAATVAMAQVTRRLLRGAPVTVTPLGLVADFGAFVGAYALTSFLYDRPNLLALILVVGWAARTVGRVPGWVIVYSLCTGAAGFVVEATLIALHQFYYQHPDWLGVARWLPAIYLHAGVLGASLAAFIERAHGRASAAT